MLRITVIDDETQITSMLRKALSRNKDLDISTYNNPIEALRELKSTKADVVLLDILMPQMDGVYALHEIKKSSPGIKVIMMTAYPTLDRVLTCHKNGADGYLLKPFESLGAVERKIIKVMEPETY